MASFDELLCYYFSCKFTNVEMLGMLVKYNKCVMSLFTLKRYLERLGLRRCVPHGYENRDLVRNEVPKQLVGSASNLSNAFSSILPMFKKWIKETFTMVELKPCHLHFLCSYIDVLYSLEPVTQAMPITILIQPVSFGGMFLNLLKFCVFFLLVAS